MDDPGATTNDALRLHDHTYAQAPTRVLGPLDEEFRPAISNMIAGIIIGVAATGGGCALVYAGIRETTRHVGPLPFWDDRGISWGAAALGALLSVIFIGGGLVLIWWMSTLISYRVYLHQGGLAIRKGANLELLPWSDVQGIEETVLHERPPLLKGSAKLLIPKVTSRTFRVHGRNGRSRNFDANELKRVDRLGEKLRQASQAWDIPWTVREVDG